MKRPQVEEHVVGASAHVHQQKRGRVGGSGAGVRTGPTTTTSTTADTAAATHDVEGGESAVLVLMLGCVRAVQR